MTTAIVTYHHASAAPRYGGSGDVVGVITAQTEDRVSLDYSSGAAHGAVDSNNARIARVVADTDCGIGVTASGVAITKPRTMPIKAGVAEHIFIPAGQRLGIALEA